MRTLLSAAVPDRRFTLLVVNKKGIFDASGLPLIMESIRCHLDIREEEQAHAGKLHGAAILLLWNLAFEGA